MKKINDYTILSKDILKDFKEPKDGYIYPNIEEFEEEDFSYGFTAVLLSNESLINKALEIFKASYPMDSSDDEEKYLLLEYQVKDKFLLLCYEATNQSFSYDISELIKEGLCLDSFEYDGDFHDNDDLLVENTDIHDALKAIVN